MKTQNKTINYKLGLLKLAIELNNVSLACKIFGFSRPTYYRYKKADLDWRTSSLRLGAALKFGFIKSCDTVVPEIFYQRDTTIEFKPDITFPEIVLKNTIKERRGNDTLVTEFYVKYLHEEKPEVIETVEVLPEIIIEKIPAPEIIINTENTLEKQFALEILKYT